MAYIVERNTNYLVATNTKNLTDYFDYGASQTITTLDRISARASTTKSNFTAFAISTDFISITFPLAHAGASLI